MTRLAPAALIVLAACGRDAPAANGLSAAAPKAPAPVVEGEVGAAERLVRRRLGNPQGLTFSNPRRSASEGVSIICGDYRQGGRSRRYIVVDRQDAFVESQMQPGEMDRAYREFCAGGARG
ncbi:MAG TPA: hypothetical protein VF704_06500 [Allosphingosinicella sp.]